MIRRKVCTVKHDINFLSRRYVRNVAKRPQAFYEKYSWVRIAFEIAALKHGPEYASIKAYN